MEPRPIKRQPRGKEPMVQKAFKLPERIATWIERGAARDGVSEARFLTTEIDRRILRATDKENAA